MSILSVISQFNGRMIEVDDGWRGLNEHEKRLGRRKAGDWSAVGHKSCRDSRSNLVAFLGKL